MRGGAFAVKHAALALAVIAAAAPIADAQAQERDLCVDRPGLGTPACTVSPGRVVAEIGLADWSADRGGGMRSDTLLIGDALVRIGVSETVELQLGWTPLGFQRDRAAGGAVNRLTRAGDALLGAKVNLASPDGSGFSVAVEPSVTLPIGRAPIGAGDWGANLVVPLSYDMSDVVQLQASPELDAAVDQDGHGRHASFGGTLGLGLGLSDAVSAGIEVQALRDRDPTGHSTLAYGGFSLGWQPAKDVQLDLGANLGLNHASNDVELYAGVSRRF